MGKPRGLIAYDTDENIKRRTEGRETQIRIWRPRTLIYIAIILLVSGIMAYALATRQYEDLNVLHDRNPIYVELQDGAVRNGYTIRLLNKRATERNFILSVEGMPQGTRIEAVGISESVLGKPVVPVGPDTTREIRVLVFSPAGADLPATTPVTFRITETVMGKVATADDFFKAP